MRFLSFIIITLLLCTSSFESISQKDSDELVKINKYLEGNKNFSVKLRYELFTNHTSLKAKERYFGFYLKFQNNHYSNLGDNETIISEKHVIQIYNSEKKIFYSNKPKNINHLTTFNLDSLSKSFKIQSNIVIAQNLSKIVLVPFDKNKSEYEKIELFYDSKSYCPQKMSIYFKNNIEFSEELGSNNKSKPRLEINFSEYNSKLGDLNIFAEKNYIVKYKKKLIGVGKYKDYSILDNTSLNRKNK